jgi:serine/threonine-protein kinase HipA
MVGLDAYLYGVKTGTFYCSDPTSVLSTISYKYSLDYLENLCNLPISLAMPLSKNEYCIKNTSNKDEYNVAERFLEGLVPTNSNRLAEIIRNKKLANTAFNSLYVKGMEQIGALQFVPEGEALPAPVYVPTNQQEIGEKLSNLRNNRRFDDNFDDNDALSGKSAAGEQDKILRTRFDSGELLYPKYTGISNLIIKPGYLKDEAQAYNEHFCTSILGEIGLRVAKTSFEYFDNEGALVSKRFDRIGTSTDTLSRIHQEDIFSLTEFDFVADKYETIDPHEPYITTVMKRLNELDSTQKLALEFVEQVFANFLIGNDDSHLRNLALMRYQDGSFQMTPMYDVSSIYLEKNIQRKKEFSLLIGNSLDLDNFSIDRLKKFALDVKPLKDIILPKIQSIAIALPTSIDKVVNQEKELVNKYLTGVDELRQRVEKISKIINISI